MNFFYNQYCFSIHTGLNGEVKNRKRPEWVTRVGTECGRAQKPEVRKRRKKPFNTPLVMWNQQDFE